MTAQRNIISSLQFALSQGGLPLYKQLYHQVISHIKQGKLNAGDRLPGSRVLADSLGVSRSTVVNGYELLIAEGVLISRSKSGIYVSGDACLLLEQDHPVRREVVAETSALMAFNSGIDAQVFPQQAWLKSMRASWRTPDPMVLQDNCPTGLPSLKQAIADYLYQLRGLRCRPEQILITAGSRDALTLIRHTLEKVSPGVHWLCENPTYPPIRELINSWQLPRQSYSQLSLDHEGCLTPDKNEKKPAETTASVLTPNRQYPTGTVMSKSRRQQWFAYLQQGKGWLIEDDYDNEFHYSGKSGIPLMQADPSGRVIFVGSFSKVLFRGLRLGFIVAPMPLCPLLLKSRNELGGSAALPMQPVVAEFMRNGEFARHINRMRRHYRQKRDYLLRLCEQYLTQWFYWQQPQGGMHLLILLKETGEIPELKGQAALSDQDIAACLRQLGIKMFPLSEHFTPPENPARVPQGFVLGFTGPDEKTITALVKALAEMMQTRTTCSSLK